MDVSTIERNYRQSRYSVKLASCFDRYDDIIRYRIFELGYCICLSHYLHDIQVWDFVGHVRNVRCFRVRVSQISFETKSHTYITHPFNSLERCRTRLLLASVLISAGVGLAATGDPNFNAEGIALLLVALLSGATRWVFTQDIMKREEVENAVQLVMVSAPWAVVTILPLALATEYEKYSKIPTDMVQPLVAICLVGGLLSFLLVYIEVLLCHLTSSMTLTVLGIMKTILQIFLGFVVFGDRLGIRNISGLALVLIGVLWCVVFVKREEFKIYSRT